MIDSVLWLSQQCAGLAAGLHNIHNARMTTHEALKVLKVKATPPTNPPLYLEPNNSSQLSTTSDNSKDNSNGKDCGRHGDIKPQNILWFMQDKNKYNMGVLKISDFGLTTFHSALTTRVLANDVPVTQTYAAPERYAEESSKSISRPFDIWSLGCVYLEFVTWILLGDESLGDFSDLRRAERGRRRAWILDSFYVVEEGREPPRFHKEHVRVKQSVLDVSHQNYSCALLR